MDLNRGNCPRHEIIADDDIFHLGLSFGEEKTHQSVEVDAVRDSGGCGFAADDEEFFGPDGDFGGCGSGHFMG